MAVWTTWVVLFKPYAADAYNFIAREQYHSDSTDTEISSAIDALSKRQSLARCLDGRSWSYKIYEIPERPTAARANAKLKTAYEEHITTKYLDDLEPIDGSEPINEVGKPDNLVLIIYPDYDMSEPQHRPLSRPLSPVHEEINPRMMRDVVASAGQKCKPPSTGAKASELAITQTSTFEAAIHDGRPLSLLGAPLAIYSEAFTQFRATMSDETLQFDPTELSSARRLVDKAAKHTPKEELRVEAMVDLSSAHRDILAEVTLQLSTDPPKKIVPDGRICATSNYQHVWPILSLTEVNSEIGAGTRDPIDKAKQDYRAIYCSEKFKPFRDVSCCPCLLVAIAGPNIMVGGAVYAEQIIATSFTSYISIAPLDVSGPRLMYDAAIWRAARLMRALKQATVALDAHYAAVTKALNAASARSADGLPTCYVGPHLTHVSADGTAISLDYTGRLCTDEPAKTLYTARARITSDSEQDPRETDVVVKFTKAAYSLEGHRLLAVHGLAPKLWFCEWVESVDMYVVVMDHVRDAETADEDVAMSVADAAAVRTAVELLHAEGLVFGDLRGPNVLLRKDGGPLLIDFDWCGPEGTACYPLGVNMHSAIPWHPDVNTGTLIKKEHDWHLLKVLTGS